MLKSIAEWLEERGLGKYVNTFAENDIDLEVLPHLTDTDLEKLGLSLGHRRKLQEAARELAVSPSPPQEISPPLNDDQTTPVGNAERRHLTVMFCDLVGSTKLSQNLDPEELGVINKAFQHSCTKSMKVTSRVSWGMVYWLTLVTRRHTRTMRNALYGRVLAR